MWLFRLVIFWSLLDDQNANYILVQEPLVDVVDRNQVVANSCLLKEIDIQTCTKDDIPFEAQFNLQIKRNDYVQVC